MPVCLEFYVDVYITFNIFVYLYNSNMNDYL